MNEFRYFSFTQVKKENKRLKARTVAISNSLVRKVDEEKKRWQMLEGTMREDRPKSIIDYQVRIILLIVRVFRLRQNVISIILSLEIS